MKKTKLFNLSLALPIFLFSIQLKAATEGTLMYKAQEQNFKSAKKLLPPLVEHHSTIKDMLKESLVPEAVDLVMQTQDLIIYLEDSKNTDIHSMLRETLELAQKLYKKYAKDDYLVVDFGVEIFNRAPYEVEKIKICDSIRDILNADPKTIDQKIYYRLLLNYGIIFSFNPNDKSRIDAETKGYFFKEENKYADLVSKYC